MNKNGLRLRFREARDPQTPGPHDRSGAEGLYLRRRHGLRNQHASLARHADVPGIFRNRHCLREKRHRRLTRANPADFASGASDLEVWPYIWQLGGDVLILPKLHAKYYRFDSRIFVGSANCTLAGLQGKTNANVELLAELEPSADAFEFEQFLLKNGFTARREDYEALKREVDVLKSNSEFKSACKLNCREEARRRLLPLETGWMPSCSEPSKAYWPAYCGAAGVDRAAMVDLERLGLPEGISSEDEFREFLGSRIAQMRFTAAFEQLFEHNIYPERPYLSWGTIRRESGIPWSKDRETCANEVNAVMDLLCYALPQAYFEPEPMTYSRLIGKAAPFAAG